MCPHCGSDNTVPRPKRHGHRCKECREDFTVRHYLREITALSCQMAVRHISCTNQSQEYQ
ncbi:MAG: hypothetical protein OXC42_06760 [Gammaproteobacteria bacterium]|nr:hypothetical protein [Gammaproteobacteria bacterium]